MPSTKTVNRRSRTELVCSVGSGRRPQRTSLAQMIRKNHVLEEQIAELRRRHDELQRNFFEAAQMQRRLCGPGHIVRSPFEFAGEIFPVRHLSGDFISSCEHGAELVFAIGDIEGKGLHAAMWFTHLLAAIRLQVLKGKQPALAVSAINRDLCKLQSAPPLTTLFLARLNRETGRLVYCNAGHPAAQVLRHDGTVERLQEGGPVMGVVPRARFSRGEVTLEPGDSLLAYSDGVVECRNQSGVEFGAERLVTAAKKCQERSARAMLFSVLGAAADFASNQHEDDMGLLVLRRQFEDGV